MPKIHSLYDRPEPVFTEVDPKSTTQQQFKEECDINNIMKRYTEYGALPMGRVGQPMFGDFSVPFDLQTAEDAIIKAKDMFYQLPAKVRAKFRNDPFELINFIEDADNQDEAIALGLIDEPEGWIPPNERKRFVEPDKPAPEPSIEDREQIGETE